MALVPFTSKETEEIAVIAWGSVMSDPFYSRVGSKETPKASLYLGYAQDKSNTEIKFAYKTIKCEFWGNQADWAARLERRDHIFVAGILARDDYMSEKSGQNILFIKAEFFVPQAAVGMAIDGYLTSDSTIPSAAERGILMDGNTGDLLFGD